MLAWRNTTKCQRMCRNMIPNIPLFKEFKRYIDIRVLKRIFIYNLGLSILIITFELLLNVT